ncbi:MAG: hypothetical protein HC860_20755 [Alkalinema sp. RU_4_3]|nr:hypothetical protein [Alkalinema sp. RU_4_3]
MTTPTSQSSAINTSTDPVRDPLYQEEQPMAPHTDIPEAELTANNEGVTVRFRIPWKNLRPIATHAAAILAPWLFTLPQPSKVFPVPHPNPAHPSACRWIPQPPIQSRPLHPSSRIEPPFTGDSPPPPKDGLARQPHWKPTLGHPL